MTDFCKTWLWRTATIASVIFLIIASFYAEENYRGIQAWKKCKGDITARGECLDWDRFVPAPVPPERNFYNAPMMTELFVKGATNPSPHLIPGGNPETTATVITKSSASNYIAWCAACEPGFDLIRTALQRPLARIDGDYNRPFQQPIPKFVSYRYVSQTLAHRAKCYLLLGEPAKALADLTLLHRLNQTLVPNHQPLTLVSAMIHVAIAGLYADTVACGLESRSWREADLATLQEQLAEIDLLPDLAYSFRAERASVLQSLGALKPEDLAREVNWSKQPVYNLGWWLMPSGWIYQNKAVFATLETKMFECLVLTNNTVSPFKAEANTAYINHVFDHITPWNFIAFMCVANFSKAAETMARNQTCVDQAQIVCALERYRLSNQKYPDNLSALEPQFIKKIPNDIIGGKPPKYSHRQDGTFTLYSIGWNEADDGGVTAHNADGKENRESGDWVWRYPTE